METISLKSELLCEGLCADDATMMLFEQQNPNAVWKTGNNGCFVEFDDTRLLVAIAHEFNNTSPYKISLSDNTLLKNGVVIKNDVKATIYPDWYNVKISTGRAFTEIFLLEGDRFFHQAYKGCDYMSHGFGCAFCATGLRGNQESTPSEIGEASEIIKNRMSNAQICLGGGTYLPILDNVRYFAECVCEIRKRNAEIPIWIEMIPPSKNEVQMLIDKGATAFGFNIELWDEIKRKEICPGKSEVTLSHYLDVLEFTAKKLPNRVGSCLLVGLDNENNIKEGINALTKIGVHPCLLPFKPFRNSKLENYPTCDCEQYVELSQYAVEQTHNAGLNILKNQGCLLCECCTIMHDIWRKRYTEELI